MIDRRGAIISDCGKYRYVLSRGCDISYIPFVMLNPSTADAMEDDPTIRRCCGFAEGFGYEGILVLNLYAYRATDPKELRKLSLEEAMGPEYFEYWSWIAGRKIICGWGNNADKRVVEYFWQFCQDNGVKTYCLGVTKTNAPKHPLYLKADTQLQEWKYK